MLLKADTIICLPIRREFNLVDGKIKNLSSQSIIGTVNNNHNKNNPHIKPIPLITSSKKLLLNLYLNIRKALINKTLIERESGIIESPYPIGPPRFLIVVIVNGKK